MCGLGVFRSGESTGSFEGEHRLLCDKGRCETIAFPSVDTEKGRGSVIPDVQSKHGEEQDKPQRKELHPSLQRPTSHPPLAVVVDHRTESIEAGSADKGSS